MSTITQTITAMPAAPSPLDTPVDFDTKAFAMAAAQEDLVTELNTWASQVNAVAGEVVTNKDAAAASASAASGSASSAAAQVSLATTQANNAASSAATALNAPGTSSTSTTSLSIGTGAKSLTIQTGKSIAVGASVIIAYTTTPTTRMSGTVTAYNSGTGALDVTVDATSGSGTYTAWTVSLGVVQSASYSPNIARSARTSNTMLTAADVGKLIDVTSGTFTQTFDAVATLGSGWYCYLRNSGSGDVTLDPSASEQIDGLTSYIMYPGECRLVQCDGSALRSVVLTPFYRVFTSTGTWTKPPGYQRFDGDLWAGGCGGGRGSGGYPGGAGGACAKFSLPASALSATETVTIGTGGLGRSTNGNPNLGGTSTFSTINAYSGDISGAGGMAYRSVQVLNDAFGISNGSSGLGMYLAGGHSIATLSSGDEARNSIWGGAGGGGVAADNTTLRTAGNSIFGGNGGAGSVSGTASDGTAPGGGGGGTFNGTSGAGARGELRIWGVV